MKKTAAIKKFLTEKTHSDLSDLYNHDMECQVNVAQDQGSRITGENKLGIKWIGYTDETGVIWKPFRIPYKDLTFDDKELKYDIYEHAEGIGLTGWDWKNKVSKWVAFDFDAITGHSKGIDEKDLLKVKENAINLPWVTVRHSTSGKGIHLYVFLENIKTENHTEHAALARSILSKMSSLTGFDFISRVDICGGNMWIWHRKMKDNGLLLIKKGEVLKQIPVNWRDHLDVINNKSPKIKSSVPEFASQKIRNALDDNHITLIKWLDSNAEKNHWWDSDRCMLVCHTLDLKRAHEELNCKGIFETASTGTSAQNCFCFPLRNGAWTVRRYSLGCSEHDSWEQASGSWTKCHFNKIPSIKALCQLFNAVEDSKGGFTFRNGEDLFKALKYLNILIDIPKPALYRTARIKELKNDKLILELPYTEYDSGEDFTGWLNEKKLWVKIITYSKDDDDLDTDEVIRHVISCENVNAGWVVNINNSWVEEPISHVRAAIKSMNLNDDDIIGYNIFKPWRLVNMPFKPEYPGDRKWNRSGAQLKIQPSTNNNFFIPTWNDLLDHCGNELDYYIQNDLWCKENDITRGSDYLKYWIASLIQYPEEPLPYLFFYSEEQSTGKSAFHEALSLLFTGYKRADNAIKNPSGFNAEIEYSILCVIEETDLNKDKQAYNRIKDWVTSKIIQIHKKHLTPYDIVNTTHWIQCSNDIDSCPVFPGDTRITMINVPTRPDSIVSKTALMEKLEQEAPDFLNLVLNIEIPEHKERLRIPVIETEDKSEAVKRNLSAVRLFINEAIYYAPGEVIRISDFFEAFVNSDFVNKHDRWTKQMVSREIPQEKFPKGRLKNDSSWYYGNMSFKPPKENKKPLIKVGDKLQ